MIPRNHFLVEPRGSNGLGKDVYFASSSDKCVVETVGKFDSRYSFKLKEDGLHWTDEEEDYDEDYDEEW